jgi:hypothetical protein
METTESLHEGEMMREAARSMILSAEESVRALHESRGGNASGLGISETWSAFPPELTEFVGNADNVLPFSPEEEERFNRLIQDAADGKLGDADHTEALNQFVEYYLQYQNARKETLH